MHIPITVPVVLSDDTRLSLQLHDHPPSDLDRELFGAGFPAAGYSYARAGVVAALPKALWLAGIYGVLVDGVRTMTDCVSSDIVGTATEHAELLLPGSSGARFDGAATVTAGALVRIVGDRIIAWGDADLATDAT